MYQWINPMDQSLFAKGQVETNGLDGDWGHAAGLAGDWEHGSDLSGDWIHLQVWLETGDTLQVCYRQVVGLVGEWRMAAGFTVDRLHSGLI